MARLRSSLTPCLALLACACTTSSPRSATRPSVLLVTLDTVRADRIGAWGRAGAGTPQLDALARDGALFRNAYTSAPLTLPAHASLLTGTTPLRHGVRDNFGHALPGEARTLAESFAAAGYRTAAVVGAAVLDRGSGVERGFAHYDDLTGAAAAGQGRGAAERRGDAVVERALGHLAGGSSPAFVWVHLYDPHLPYEAPAEPRGLHPDDAYQGEISWVDTLVGRLVARVRDGARAADWIVAVTADHGEGLGDHGEPDHGVFLYDSTLHVPLVLHAPGRVAPRTIDALVRDVDLMPTLLELAGLAVPPGLDGESLRPLLEGRAAPARSAYAETHYARLHYGWSSLRALRDERFKLIEAPVLELYDLARDASESLNVAAAHPRTVEALRSELATLVAAAPASSAQATRGPDAIERLRSLGYAGGVVQIPEAEPLPDPKSKRAALPLLSRATAESLDLIEAGRAREALALLDSALAAEPRFLDGHVLRGEALYRLERFGEAARAFERALALDPDSAETLYDVARARAANGELEAALARLAEARRRAPDDPRIDAAEARIHAARRKAGT